MTEDLNKRHQSMVILWFALLMNIGLFFLLAIFAAPERTYATAPQSSLWVFVLTAVGTLLVLLSFAVKRKLLERSIDNQDVKLVQIGLVVACAMCELSALLGLLECFVIGNRDFYLLFIIAAVGTAFHFPRRQQLLAATYKKSSGGML
ncbi:MAG: hypothetical protein M3539_09480 [Acidobacteriota bacterium]|nr:hypothetical protein [Acidobacteriota bacterium]